MERQIKASLDILAVPASWGFNGKPEEKQEDPLVGELDDLTGRKPWPHELYLRAGRHA